MHRYVYFCNNQRKTREKITQLGKSNNQAINLELITLGK